MAVQDGQLLEMLRKMILIREFDELAIKLRMAGKIYGAVHPYVGQEAVAVGVCAILTDRDRVTSTHRGHGHCIAKGADIKRMMAELFGRVDGYCKGKGGSMHIADFAVGMLGANGIVGGGLPIASGRRARRAARRQGQRRGLLLRRRRRRRGRVPRGAQHLPRCGSCRSSSSARTTSTRPTTRWPSQHPLADIAAHAAAYGMPGVIVDGNDVLAVGRGAREAVDRARRGDGPTLLECKTYRWHFHAMRNAPPPETRPAEEIADWKERDPIARFETHLIGAAGS